MIINFFLQCSSMPILRILNYFFTGCRIKACRVKAAKNIKGAAFIWLPAFTPEPPGLMLRWHGSRSGALYYLMLEIVFVFLKKLSRSLSNSKGRERDADIVSSSRLRRNEEWLPWGQNRCQHFLSSFQMRPWKIIYMYSFSREPWS